MSTFCVPPKTCERRASTTVPPENEMDSARSAPCVIGQLGTFVRTAARLGHAQSPSPHFPGRDPPRWELVFAPFDGRARRQSAPGRGGFSSVFVNRTGIGHQVSDDLGHHLIAAERAIESK